VGEISVEFRRNAAFCRLTFHLMTSQFSPTARRLFSACSASIKLVVGSVILTHHTILSQHGNSQQPQPALSSIITMSFAIPSPFTWDESFDVQSDQFNTQHKELFRLINDLDADRSSAAKLTALVDYVVLHFKDEEAAMTAAGFAEFDGHKAIHDKFLADAGAVTSVDEGVMNFIKQWLVTHIKASDKQYAGKL
jgi:hemerythrin